MGIDGLSIETDDNEKTFFPHSHAFDPEIKASQLWVEYKVALPYIIRKVYRGHHNEGTGTGRSLHLTCKADEADLSHSFGNFISTLH